MTSIVIGILCVLGAGAFWGETRRLMTSPTQPDTLGSVTRIVSWVLAIIYILAAITMGATGAAFILFVE